MSQTSQSQSSIGYLFKAARALQSPESSGRPKKVQRMFNEEESFDFDEYTNFLSPPRRGLNRSTDALHDLLQESPEPHLMNLAREAIAAEEARANIPGAQDFPKEEPSEWGGKFRQWVGRKHLPDDITNKTSDEALSYRLTCIEQLKGPFISGTATHTVKWLYVSPIEVCPTTNRLHIHFCFNMDKTKRWKPLHECLPGYWLAPRKGTPSEAMQYCHKEGPAFEWGTRPIDGFKEGMYTAITNAMYTVNEGTDMHSYMCILEGLRGLLDWEEEKSPIRAFLIPVKGKGVQIRGPNTEPNLATRSNRPNQLNLSDLYNPTNLAKLI